MFDLRLNLLSDLEKLIPFDADEKGCVEKIIDLIQTKERCFYRDLFDPGHITGSALLVNRDNTKTLMNHHGALDKWLCFGGHADGEADIRNVAKREIQEESGIKKIAPFSMDIFDVDIHPISMNSEKGEPAHFHLDIRYLFYIENSDCETFKISDESKELRWCDYEKALSLVETKGMRRLLMKWQEKWQMKQEGNMQESDIKRMVRS